jgi:hypothetical protein
VSYGLIYGLFCPEGRLRYIGQTTKPAVEQRLAEHMRRHLLRHPRQPVTRWLAKLVANGLSPSIRKLTSADDRDELDRLEVEWIRNARASVRGLLNATDGGGGSVGAKRSPETRAKLSALRTGKKLSAETRSKMSTAKRGTPLYRSPEHAAKLGALRRGRYTASQRLGLAHAQLPGELNPQAKLTWEKVRKIREELASGQTIVRLATEYGVTHSLISRIRLRKAWK